jgi:hypothetical protein
VGEEGTHRFLSNSVAGGMQLRRLPTTVAAAGLGLLLGACGVSGERTTQPSGHATSAAELISGVSVSARVTEVSLVAVGASADFGIDEGVRRVNVRVVDELRLEVRIESRQDVVLEGPPSVCLIGPFWNPLDAGLSDRCWGDPDAAEVLAAQLPTDEAGRPTVPAGQPIVVNATLSRGDLRCDYSPGEWQLEIAANPIVGGLPAGTMDVASVTLLVSFAADEPLELLPPSETRLCSYPAAVYLRQGDPPIALP